MYLQLMQSVFLTSLNCRLKRPPAKAEIFYLKVSLVSFVDGNLDGAGIPTAMAADVVETENSGDSSSSVGTLEAESSDSEEEFSANDEAEEWMEGTPSFSEDSEELYCSDDSEAIEINMVGGGADVAANHLLYDGAPITVSASYLMLFLFAKKYQLTIDGFQALLELVKSHCPQHNKCAPSVYKLKAFFSEKFIRDESTKKMKFCSICSSRIVEGGVCSEAGCVGANKAPVEFYCGDLTPQLRKKIEG